jgi:uncharacterized protein with ParB-like and HNH nuclease domain
MAAGNLLDTKTFSLNDILGNGKIYHVPQFQRDYSWDRDNWEDLWNDIEIAESTQSAHYMGSIVLQNNGGKDYQIIDGQQRLTTLSILTLAVINAISQLIDRGAEIDENRERIDLLMRQYIGHKDPSSLKYSSKLFLNENNDGFYQNRLLSFKSPINVRKLSDSEKLMWEAYLFFCSKVEAKLFSKSGEQLATFLNKVVGELMMFIQITVQDELNAYTVFETLNSRGVELTSTDLLKNYLFSLVAKSETDLKQVKNQWKKIIDAVGLKEFPAFLRYFLLATRKQITKEYLFKEVKSYIKVDQDVFDLLDQLEYYAYNYTALGNADDEMWVAEKDNRNAINILKSFKVTQWKPLMMVAFEKLSNRNEFKRLLNAIVVTSYRYNVIGKLQTNLMESIYSKAAIQLHRSDNPQISTVLQSIKELYVSDEDFRHYFELKQFNTNNSAEKKLLRYTLYSLEAQLGGGSYDFEIDNGTIEHILPESYPENWQQYFTEEEFERNVYMVGNLTLLEPSKNNKDAANKIFEEKKDVYSESKYIMTKELTEQPQWTAQNIKYRQARLAKIASAVWKIQF